jgi:hypothetical protein
MKICKFVGGAALLTLTAPAALADTYLIDEINSGITGVTCTAAAPCGDVIVTSSGTTYTITVDLNLSSGLQLHETPGNPQTVSFNLAGVSAIVSGPVTNLAVPTGTQDGFGSFAAGVDCSSSPVGSLCVPTGISPSNELVFQVTAPAGETLTLNGLGGSYLSLDAAGPGVGNTGFVASNLLAVPGPIVGAGLPGLITACGGLLALGRRRRRNALTA